MKRIVAALVFFLFASLAFADVSVIERRGLSGQSGPTKPKREGRGQTRTGEVSLTDASGLDYFINSNITFTTSSSASGAASEASYSAPVQADTSGGGSTTATLDDAFDGFGSLCVSLDGSSGPCDSGGQPGRGAGVGTVTMYNDNGAGTLDASCGNRQLILNNQLIGAVRVQRKIFVPSNDTFIRWYQTFTNTGNATENVTAITGNNLGSDANTAIVTTSSGDATVTTADTWLTSFEAFSGTTSPDVRLGHVLWGPGAATGLNGITFSNGVNNPFWSYRFSLAPGETKAILTFATGQPTRALAASKAAELVGLPDNATQCLTTAELNQTANFAGQGPFVTEVPTVSTVGLVLTVLLLGGASFFVLRRRPTVSSK